MLTAAKGHQCVNAAAKCIYGEKTGLFITSTLVHPLSIHSGTSLSLRETLGLLGRICAAFIDGCQ